MRGQRDYTWGDSLSRRERQVLRMWDNNSTMDEIAQELGMRRDLVSDIISTFSEGDERKRHQASMAAGSAALLAAMKAA